MVPTLFWMFSLNNCRFLLLTKFRLKQDWSVSASSHFLMKIYFLWWWDTCWDKVPVKSSRVDLEHLPFPCWSVSFFHPWCIFDHFWIFSEFSLMKCSKIAFPISVIILQWKNHHPKKLSLLSPPTTQFWILSRWFFLFQFGGIRDSFPAEVFCLMRKFAPWVYVREVWQGEKWVVKLESWD